MKKSKVKKIMDRIRRFLDEGYNKKLKDREEVFDSLAKMKKREKKLKEKLAKESDPDTIKKLGQELDIIKKLRSKAKDILKGEEKDK